MFEQDGRLVVKVIGQPGLAATLTGLDRIEIAQFTENPALSTDELVFMQAGVGQGLDTI